MMLVGNPESAKNPAHSARCGVDLFFSRCGAKRQVYMAMALSRLPYGSESWCYLAQKLWCKLLSFHHRCVRIMCGISMQHVVLDSDSACAAPQDHDGTVPSAQPLRSMKYTRHDDNCNRQVMLALVLARRAFLNEYVLQCCFPWEPIRARSSGG